MHPYHEQGFFLFIVTLWKRLFLFVCGGLNYEQLATEDLQLYALILCGSLAIIVGFYLIHNKMTMLANSLSHTILFGLIVTFLLAHYLNPTLGVDGLSFYWQMLASIITALLTVLSLKFLSSRISSEASNALSFTGFFALGILLSSLVLKNTHLGLESVLGNLEGILFTDVVHLFFALMMTLAVFALMRSRLLVVSFDELFAHTIGIKVGIYKNILIFISSVVLMVCFRSMGVILILSMITSPIVSAKVLTSDRKRLLKLAFMILALQITLSMGLVQALYVNFDLPVSTGGLYGFLGLLTLFICKVLKKGLQRKKGCHFPKNATP